MKIVDANVLLYAVNSDAAHHEKARAWLDHALSGNDTVGFSWVALLAFVRISSRAGIFSDPLSVEDATQQIADWLAAPGAVVAQPGPGHAEHLTRLLHQLGTGGNLVNDAHLAALALESRAEIVSYDNDLARFSGVRWRRPDDILA